MDSNLKLNRIQKNVLEIIKYNPTAADDEALLLTYYWTNFDHWDGTKDLLTNLSHVTRPETISRRRRELFNMGLITYSENKFQERMEAYKSEKIRPKVQANLFKFWSKQ